MNSPIILEGVAFDWAEGAQLAERHGGANTIRGAMFVDPGCMSCPGCDEMLWREGIRVRCPHCGHEWTVASPGRRTVRAIRARIERYSSRGPRTVEGQRLLAEELAKLYAELAQATEPNQP